MLRNRGIAYSVQQRSDGGYSVAGAGHLKFPSGAPLVPWLAKTDPSGNLVWQYSYYQSYPTTGSPISQYFASSTLTSDGGYLSLGFTENPVDGKVELFAVRTDSTGLVGTCSQIHSRLRATWSIRGSPPSRRFSRSRGRRPPRALGASHAA